MAGYGKSLQMLTVKGIKWTEGNKDYFLHLDQHTLTAWYGWIFRANLGDGYLSFKKASENNLLKIIRNLVHDPGYYSKGEINV